MAAAGYRLRWEPPPPFGKLLARVRNPGPMRHKLEDLMLQMASVRHELEGPGWKPCKRKEKDKTAKTGTKGGRLKKSWRRVRVSGSNARIENAVYKGEFYLGHPARTVTVPAHYRRMRRKVRLEGQKRKRMQTVAITMVRSHTKREKAQPARPIFWTRDYIKRAENVILGAILQGA